MGAAARRAPLVQLCPPAVYGDFSSSKQRNTSSHKSGANARCLGTPAPLHTARARHLLPRAGDFGEPGLQLPRPGCPERLCTVS